jgi:cell division septum initiation protein DivIVA
MTDEELAELERQCAEYEMVHHSMVIPLIAALREARALAAERYEAAEEMHEALGEPSQRSPRTFAAVVAERDALRADYADLLAERDAMQSLATQATREADQLRADCERWRTEVEHMLPVVAKVGEWRDCGVSPETECVVRHWDEIADAIDTYRAGGGR